jgi:hypothetical protein
MATAINEPWRSSVDDLTELPDGVPERERDALGLPVAELAGRRLPAARAFLNAEPLRQVGLA